MDGILQISEPLEGISLQKQQLLKQTLGIVQCFAPIAPRRLVPNRLRLRAFHQTPSICTTATGMRRIVPHVPPVYFCAHAEYSGMSLCARIFSFVAA